MSFLATLGGIATGAADFLSPILGYKSNKETNNANLEIAQMNNEWSERMMEKQNAMNIDQWNREKQFALEQRDYDSATQQASRLRAAGLNPNLIMGGQNAGSAASTPSGSSVGLPSPSSATMQPYDFSGFARAFEGAINIGMALRRNQAEIHNLESQANYNNAKANFENAEAFERTRNLKIKNLFAYDLEKNNVANSFYQSESYKAKSNFDNAMASYTISQNLLKQKELNAFDERNKLTLSLLSADIGLKVAQKKLSLNQAKTEWFKQAESSFRATNQRINNELLNKTFEALVFKAINDSRSFNIYDLGRMGSVLSGEFGELFK